MTTSAPWLLGQALAYVAEGTDERSAVDGLLTAAQHSWQALEGAYGRAVALVGYLPADEKAREAMQLITKAMRRTASDSGDRVLHA